MPSPLGSQLHPVAVAWILPPPTQTRSLWLLSRCPLLQSCVVADLTQPPVWLVLPRPLARWHQLVATLRQSLLLRPWKCAFLWPLVVVEAMEATTTAPAQAPVHPLFPLTLLLQEDPLVGVAIPLATEVGLPLSHQLLLPLPTIPQPLS